MAKIAVDSWFNSLKAKVQLAAAALAIFVALFGLLAYCIDFLFGNSFYVVMLPFFFLSATVFFFGRWLSKEISSPVEKVSLLAKSFERGVSTSLPKTSGSTETDELTQTIARISAQSQKLVGLMEELAGGNLNVVFSQKIESDRTVQSFQKLLAKVAESIHAQAELNRLQNSVRYVSGEAATIKQGDLDAKIVAADVAVPEVKEIVETINYLLERLGEITIEVKNGGAQAQQFTAGIQKTINVILERGEHRLHDLSQAQIVLKQVPGTVQKIYDEVSQSSFAVNQSIEKAREGATAAHENLNAVSSFRRRIQETLKGVQHLTEQIQEISKIAKTIEDLGQRAGIIALNTSLHADGTTNSLAVVSEEIERLAKRASNAGKQISVLDKTVQADIRQIETTLSEASAEIANLSKLAIESGDALEELEKYASKILALHNKISEFSAEKNLEAEKAFGVIITSISETETSLSELKVAAKNTAQISGEISELQNLTATLKISDPAPSTIQNEITKEPYSQDYLLPETNITVL